MEFVLKLLSLLAVPILIVVGVIFSVSWLLNVDDLPNCANCKPVDAIVAISGGDTDARTAEAIRLYHDGWAPKLIMSGAALDKTGQSNAAAMRQQALDSGVPAADISIDEQAANTAGNAAGLQEIAKSQQLTRIILVTSPYHQRRASIEFARALGPSVTIINHPTPGDRYWHPHRWWADPYSWYLALTEIGKLIYVSAVAK